jgi:hypothetical protein
MTGMRETKHVTLWGKRESLQYFVRKQEKRLIESSRGRCKDDMKWIINK